MAVRIIVRNGTSSQWSSENPLLSEGELGIESDTKHLKVGNGVDNWNDLSYWYIGDRPLSPFLLMGV